MPGSSFDPNSRDAAYERDGFLPPTAENISHMPESAVDGKFEEDEDATVPLIGEAAVAPLNPADTKSLSDAAAEAIRHATRTTNEA